MSAGLLADRVLGEPPDAIHPVAVFGTAMKQVERVVYRDSRAAGVVHAATGVALGAAAGRLVRSRAVAVYVAASGRMLGSTALRIGAHLEAGDLAAARTALPALVGRDVSELDRTGLTRAVVESVAENSVDAVVAPALWGAVAGAPGALVHRAVNTMDAMVGYRTPRYERYGWASARLDDAMAWVPARATAALVATLRPSMARDVWRAVREDAPSHASPNSGVAEAAFAAALGVRLGGTIRLGRGRSVEPRDIARAVRLLDDVTFALAGVLAVVRR